MKAVSFDSNDLQTDNILVSDITDTGARLDLSVARLPHANKSLVSFADYKDRVINLRGKIIGSTPDDLESRVDTFRAYFNTIDGNLDIGHAGSTRRYIATAQSIDITQPGGLKYANFDVSMLCADPFGRNTTSTSILSATGRTSASYSDNYTFGGTAPIQLPIITITYNTVTGGSNYAKVGNVETGQTIIVMDTTFVDDDVLVIDCMNRTVTVNGVEVEFEGAFPEFKPGARTIAYADWFTTRNFDISITYYPLYK